MMPDCTRTLGVFGGPRRPGAKRSACAARTVELCTRGGHGGTNTCRTSLLPLRWTVVWRVVRSWTSDVHTELTTSGSLVCLAWNGWNVQQQHVLHTPFRPRHSHRPCVPSPLLSSSSSPSLSCRGYRGRLTVSPRPTRQDSARGWAETTLIKHCGRHACPRPCHGSRPPRQTCRPRPPHSRKSQVPADVSAQYSPSWRSVASLTLRQHCRSRPHLLPPPGPSTTALAQTPLDSVFAGLHCPRRPRTTTFRRDSIGTSLQHRRRGCPGSSVAD